MSAIIGEVQAAILAQRRPPVAQLDVELCDGTVERVTLGTGRYRAREAAATVAALGAVAVRLLSRDGSVVRALRLVERESPVMAVPQPAASAPPEGPDERALRLVSAIYDRAHEQATASAAASIAATAAERELSWRGIGRAIEVMCTAVDRAAAQLSELHERERDTSAREVEAAATATESATGMVSAALRELPAAMPAITAMAQIVRG